MWESKISGWRVDWRCGSEQLRRHADALNSLVGASLTGAWTIWIDDTNWFADGPVVLRFDGSRQLEICWQKFDDLSISWNTINTEVEPTTWVGDVSWRPWKHLALSSNQGESVTHVAATDVVVGSTDIDDPLPYLSTLSEAPGPS